jgi:hypothetical protein
MWANYLTRPLDLFSLERPVVFGALETVTVGRGIDDRWWGPAPADLAAEEEGHEQSRAAAALAGSGASAKSSGDRASRAVLMRPASC